MYCSHVGFHRHKNLYLFTRISALEHKEVEVGWGGGEGGGGGGVGVRRMNCILRQ